LNTYEENQKKISGNKDNPEINEITGASIPHNDNAVLRKPNAAINIGNTFNK
jgi:hypothetical protein